MTTSAVIHYQFWLVIKECKVGPTIITRTGNAVINQFLIILSIKRATIQEWSSYPPIIGISFNSSNPHIVLDLHELKVLVLLSIYIDSKVTLWPLVAVEKSHHSGHSVRTSCN